MSIWPGHGQRAAQQNDRDQVLEPDQNFVVNHFGLVPETPADHVYRAGPCDDRGRGLLPVSRPSRMMATTPIPKLLAEKRLLTEIWV